MEVHQGDTAVFSVGSLVLGKVKLAFPSNLLFVEMSKCAALPHKSN